MANCSVCNRRLSVLSLLLFTAIKRCKECNVRYGYLRQSWQNTIETAFARDGVSLELENALYQAFNEHRMPADLAQPVLQRLKYVRLLTEIRWGNLPVIHIDIHLDSDEIPHFEIPSTFWKPMKIPRLLPGRLIGTNKKLYFITETGQDSKTIDWNNVVKIEMFSPGKLHPTPHIQIQLSKATGGIFYVQDTLYAKTIMDASVKIWKRQLVRNREEKTHGEIPQHTKNAVFKRDNGTCVQCGYQGQYLEYDHIIPRSKGGTNAVGNIQLLCRGCNGKKGARI